MLLMPRKARPTVTEAEERSVIACLLNNLYRTVHDAQDYNEVCLPFKDQQANEGASGLPLHCNPLLSQGSLAADERLLHVLSVDMVQGACSALECLQAQGLILDSWSRYGSMYPASAAVLAAMASSIVSRLHGDLDPPPHA